MQDVHEEGEHRASSEAEPNVSTERIVNHVDGSIYGSREVSYSGVHNFMGCVLVTMVAGRSPCLGVGDTVVGAPSPRSGLGSTLNECVEHRHSINE